MFTLRNIDFKMETGNQLPTWTTGGLYHTSHPVAKTALKFGSFCNNQRNNFSGATNDDKWGVIFGDIVVRTADKLDSYKYVSKAASGLRIGFEEAWSSLLTAHSVMDGGIYNGEDFEGEKEIFLASMKA
ncbi:hypothetical protein PHMEG_00010875 [Phytophthora megakarya]|uniref:Uncharacterized protein n=1 Tax=Phytophthora megakarya TaxID=4795 RepID=A0A225WE05_9STRA|nr:hypothetical protein PHMEG_00010875 [Phytophthora megakarya]